MKKPKAEPTKKPSPLSIYPSQQVRDRIKELAAQDHGRPPAKMAVILIEEAIAARDKAR